MYAVCVKLQSMIVKYTSKSHFLILRQEFGTMIQQSQTPTASLTPIFGPNYPKQLFETQSPIHHLNQEVVLSWKRSLQRCLVISGLLRLWHHHSSDKLLLRRKMLLQVPHLLHVNYPHFIIPLMYGSLQHTSVLLHEILTKDVFQLSWPSHWIGFFKNRLFLGFTYSEEYYLKNLLNQSKNIKCLNKCQICILSYTHISM